MRWTEGEGEGMPYWEPDWDMQKHTLTQGRSMRPKLNVTEKVGSAWLVSAVGGTADAADRAG